MLFHVTYSTLRVTFILYVLIIFHCMVQAIVLFTYVLFVFLPLLHEMLFCYCVLVSLQLPVQVSLFTV